MSDDKSLPHKTMICTASKTTDDTDKPLDTSAGAATSSQTATPPHSSPNAVCLSSYKYVIGSPPSLHQQYRGRPACRQTARSCPSEAQTLPPALLPWCSHYNQQLPARAVGSLQTGEGTEGKREGWRGQSHKGAAGWLDRSRDNGRGHGPLPMAPPKNRPTGRRQWAIDPPPPLPLVTGQTQRLGQYIRGISDRSRDGPEVWEKCACLRPH